MTRQSICAEAARIITTDRNNQYGEPEDLFEAIALAWDALDLARGDRDFTRADVAIRMAAFKLIRAAANPSVRDIFVDAVGYAAIAGELAERDRA